MPSTDRPRTLREGVPLAPHTTLGVGGSARWFLRAESAADVAGAVSWAGDHRTELVVLGGGSNLVVADAGIDALVLQIAIPGTTFTREGTDTLLTAGAGEAWDAVVAASVNRDLAGLECLSGIPGTAGGTPIQNVGAYGQEVAQTVARVDVYDRLTGEWRSLTAAECSFAYRMSRFKRDDAGRFIVCGVTFRLRGGDPAATYPDVVAHFEREGIVSPTLSDVRMAVLAVRRRKGMVLDPADSDTRSVGSFFMNPVVATAERNRIASIAGAEPPAFLTDDGLLKISAAWLIERAGFQRGFGDGAAAISGKHTLALVNRGGATARDVLRLAARIKRGVADRFGVLLRPEPVFVGLEGDPDAQYLQSQP